MPAIQPAAAMVKRGFDAYLSAHNLAPNTIHIYHFTVEQYLHCYPRLTYRNLQLYKIYLIESTINLKPSTCGSGRSTLILNTAKQTFVRFRW